MAIIGGDQGKAGESKGSGRKADDLRLSCLCLLLMSSNFLSDSAKTYRASFKWFSNSSAKFSSLGERVHLHSFQ